MCLHAVRQKCIDVSYTLINRQTEARSFPWELVYFHRNKRWICEEHRGRRNVLLMVHLQCDYRLYRSLVRDKRYRRMKDTREIISNEHILFQITVIMWNSVWKTGARTNGEGPVRLRWLVAGLPPPKPGFETRSLNMGFVLNEVEPGQVSLQVLRFYEPSPLQSTLDTNQTIFRAFLSNEKRRSIKHN
jgi:hypothetical protein